MVLAHVAVVVVGLDLPVVLGTSATLGLGIVLAPVLASVFRRHPIAFTITAVSFIAAFSGIVLSELASIDHAVSQPNRISSLGLLFSGISAILVILWARSRIPLHRIIALYGLGAVVGSVANGELSWKFDLAVPTILLVLGVIESGRRPGWTVIAIVGLGVLGALDDGRSLFGLCLLAALITLWQLPRAKRTARMNRWLPAVLVAGLGLVVYFLASALLTGGYLGSSIEERSTAQVETTGSLITGGRPEWAATRALVADRPEGFGVGVVPSWSDYIAGKNGLSSINVDTGGYAKYYLFGGQFRLHSVAADLWVSYGWAGVLLAVLLVYALVRSLSFSLAAHVAPTSVTFACVLALWYMLFGPIYTNWLDVCAAVGFAIAVTPAVGRPPSGSRRRNP